MQYYLDFFGNDPSEHSEKKPTQEPNAKSVNRLEDGKIPETTVKEASPPVSLVEDPNPSVETKSSAVNIPEDQELNSKLYYPIGEVAHMFNVNISLIRYWEKEFDILKPKKNRKGDRFFRPDDIRHLKMIYFLLKEKKYTIEGAKIFLKKGMKVGAQFETIEVLKHIKSMLLELKAGLSR